MIALLNSFVRQINDVPMKITTLKHFCCFLGELGSAEKLEII